MPSCVRVLVCFVLFHIVEPRSGLVFTNKTAVTIVVRRCNKSDSLVTDVSVSGHKIRFTICRKLRWYVLLNKPAVLKQSLGLIACACGMC